MQDSIAVYHTAEDMARKPAAPKPQGPVSTRLTPEQLERLSRFMQTTGELSRNEVLQILIQMALDQVDEDPQSFVRTHLKMQEGRLIKK
jgi:hypothetical protein